MDRAGSRRDEPLRGAPLRRRFGCSACAHPETFGLSRDLAQLREMAELVENVFCAFDHSGTGAISRADFLIPNIGLADALIAASLHRMSQRSPGGA